MNIKKTLLRWFFPKLSRADEIIHRQGVTIKLLEYETKSLNKKLEERGPANIPVIGFDLGVEEPTDSKDRVGYVERVDEFYTDVLKDKLHLSIGQVRELYGNLYMEGNLNIPRQEYDWFVRGVEAGLFKIDEWCRTLQAERNSILQEEANKEE